VTKSTITRSNSTFLNKQLQLLYRLERRFQQHIELSEYQEGRNSYWEEELLDYVEVLQRALR
jgi:hypothetical protein